MAGGGSFGSSGVVVPTSTIALARRLLSMSGPMMLTQLGTMLFGVVDTLMLGRVGVAELDAAALGNVWLWGTIVVCIGIVLGLVTFVWPGVTALMREEG